MKAFEYLGKDCTDVRTTITLSILYTSLVTFVTHLSLQFIDLISEKHSHAEPSPESSFQPKCGWVGYKLKIILKDAVCCIETVICSLENSIFYALMGISGLNFALCVNHFRFTMINLNRTSSNPIGSVIRYLKGKYDESILVASIILQILSGNLALFLTSYFWWSKGLSKVHYERFVLAEDLRKASFTGELRTKYQSNIQMNLVYAFFVEYFGMVSDFFVQLVLAMILKKYIAKDKRYMYKCLFWPIVVYFHVLTIDWGIQKTGMFTNPINALVFEWGMGDFSIPRFLFVYCLGPLAAVYTIHVIWNRRMTRLSVTFNDTELTNESDASTTSSFEFPSSNGRNRQENTATRLRKNAQNNNKM